MKEIKNGNNEALLNQAIFRTNEVDAHLKTLKVSKVSSEIKQVLATIGRDVHSLNRIELSQFQYLLALGTKIVKLMTVFDSKNSKQWGEIKKTFGFGKQSLSETQYKLALKVVKWESQIKSYFSPFGVNPFEMTNTGIRNKTKLKTFSNKYGLKMQCSPNGVVSQIEAYEKTNNPINFERVTGNKVKTTKPVEVKKPTQKQLATVSTFTQKMPVKFRENVETFKVTKKHIGLTLEELIAVAQNKKVA
jgi:hypothetical protein